MGLIAMPPAPPRADLDLNLFLGGGRDGEVVDRRCRTMPAEWFPQSAVQLTWPHQDTDWKDMLAEVTECYIRMAYEIATRQPLLVVAPDTAAVKQLLSERLPERVVANITFFAAPTNDTWARDHAFISVIDGAASELLDFRFNGWGGKFEAALDNAINRRLYDAGLLKGTYIDCLDFELEGGSIESDGQGTLLTTSRCLLNPNRNGGLSQAVAEERLKRLLGVERILWLHHGYFFFDESYCHIDTLARFCTEDIIAYVSCNDPRDSHYEPLAEMEKELQALRTAKGEPYKLVALPMPRAIFDEDGERLPATYANFLIMNTAVLYPTYAQPDNDEAARRILAAVFPKKDIVGIDCRALIRQHGSLHCATMQYPRGIFQLT